MLDGNLAITMGFSEDGSRASEIITDLISSFVVNTLDFRALDKWDASFTKGVYRIRNGGNTFDVRMMVLEDFGAYHAGDTIKENLFEPGSFVRSVKVNLNGSVSFSQGPLYSLVSGNITWKNLDPKFRLDATKLSLNVVSNGLWRFPSWSWLDNPDSILSRMSSTLNLNQLKSDFNNGRVGFSYDSTRYSSKYLDLDQSIYASLFEMRPLDSLGKTWSWEGDYRSRVDKTLSYSNKSLRVYMHGWVSSTNGNGNRAGYYCDEEMLDSIGVAVRDTSGKWGYFKSVNGDSIAYGLVPAVK